jgi:hypothetical protein
MGIKPIICWLYTGAKPITCWLYTDAKPIFFCPEARSSIILRKVGNTRRRHIPTDHEDNNLLINDEYTGTSMMKTLPEVW